MLTPWRGLLLVKVAMVIPNTSVSVDEVTSPRFLLYVYMNDNYQAKQ